jgi:membrane dipeptidase
MKQFIKFFTFFGMMFLLACTPQTPPESAQETPEPQLSLEDRARQIHDNIIVLDTHIDIPPEFGTEAVDPGELGPFQVDLPKMEQGGLNTGFFIVYVGQTARTEQNYAQAQEEAMTKFNGIRRMTNELYPERIELAHSVADVRRIRKAGKLAALIGIENGYVIGKDLSLLKTYYDLGGRYITLAHVGHNDIADSSSANPDNGDEEAEHNGVSEFGREVIAEMNRLGIMVDVSHISKQSMLDAALLSKAPVIASHSSVKSLMDVSRNMDDEELLALKENGGVVHITAVDFFVKQHPPEKDALYVAYYDEVSKDPALTPKEVVEKVSQRVTELDEKWPKATVSEFVDHIDYAVNLIGIDHVGISSDFDGGGGIAGWDDASETFNVTLELVRRDYSEEDIAKLWGENLLRVLSEVEQVAAASP